ncbi:restriction endonuclease subunit S [Sphaerotilus sulfidivorans]|nr:type I restriction enzyme specificity protein [Sphaerotilus natans]
MSLPKYPHYKPSGVQWLGDVPAHWELKRLRRCLQLNPSKSEIACESRNKEVSFLPMEAIGDDGRLDLSRTRPVNEVETGYTYFRDGDVTLAKITPCFENGKGALMTGLVGGFGFGTTELIVARPAPGRLSSEFLNWLFCSPNFRREGEACMYGAGGQKRVPDDFVRTLVWAVPPVGEQTAIAHFLDHETAKIDALIAEQEKLIHLLAEKRQATLSHAVTRGLDPAAPMKDSGVAWLGEVPAHWEILTFQRCVYVQEGQVDPENEPFRSMILIAPNHVESGTGRILGTETAQEQAAESGKYLCKSGDVIYSKIRPALRKVCIAPEDCLCSADMYPLRGIAGLSNSFLMWFMLSEPFSALAVLESERVAMPKINRESLKAVWVPVPSLQEQVKISTFLAQETTRLDTLRAEAERAIALLKERRAALIAAAVTGQIDVRQNSEILNGGEARDAVAALS